MRDMLIKFNKSLVRLSYSAFVAIRIIRADVKFCMHRRVQGARCRFTRVDYLIFFSVREKRIIQLLLFCDHYC